jgi:glycosyltransferase involved in cell wall biosynthesis
VAQGRAHDRIVLAGWMPPPELRGAFARATVYVQPSEPDPRTGDEDGIPNALIEAMACGVPVVATRAGGIPEVVRHGETGLLTEPGDDVALARAIQQVLDEPDVAERRARAARRLIEQEHDAERAGLRLMRALVATVP